MASSCILHFSSPLLVEGKTRGSKGVQRTVATQHTGRGSIDVKYTSYMNTIGAHAKMLT